MQRAARGYDARLTAHLRVVHERSIPRGAPARLPSHPFRWSSGSELLDVNGRAIRSQRMTAMKTQTS